MKNAIMEKFNKETIEQSIKNNLYPIFDKKPLLAKNKSNKSKYNYTNNINKLKTNMQSKTERETIIFNNINNKENYSIELDNDDKEEEEEFNSDENISSTMLDVDTNTYINDTEIKSSSLVSNINDNKTNKNSPLKMKEKNNIKKMVKSTYNENIVKNNNNGNSNSSDKKYKNNNYFSSIDNVKNKDIFYKKLKIKTIQNNIETLEEKGIKQKTQKDLRAESICSQKEKGTDTKNYSMMAHKATLNSSINCNDNTLKLDITNNNINNKYINLIKNKINCSKNGFKKIRLDINELNNTINEKNKTCKHKKSPTMINSNSINKNYNNIKDIIIMQKYNKMNGRKNYKKLIISPKIQKNGIKNMKILNSTNANANTLNNIDSPSISLPNNNKLNRIFYFNTNNNTNKINNNNTISIHNNINNIINVNNFKNINHINNIIFSPLKKRLDKNANRNTTSSYRYNPFDSNSMSIEINNFSNCKKNSKNKISDKLFTYSCQDQTLLSRNKTFKNKRYLNKFLNLLINKNNNKINNKLNYICDNDIIKYKKNIKQKSPDINKKINNFKTRKDNINENTNQNIHNKSIGIQKLKNKNNNFVKYSKLNSCSNKNQSEQFKLYKKGQKFNPKHYIYIKKEKLPHITQQSNKKNYDNNPFHRENQSVNNKNISTSKDKYSLNKALNANFTSVNLIKNAYKNKKIKLDIGSKKKNKYRAKTLMEEDYLRALLISNNKEKKENENKNEIDKDTFFKDYKYYKNDNNKSVNNNSIGLNQNNGNNENYRYYERKTNTTPLSTKDITFKTPFEKNGINFNININMNNNNYKKLIYYCHAHNNSSINYSYMNQKERNSNISSSPIKKKKENDLNMGINFTKRNSKDIYKNEYKLNKKFDNYSSYNFNINQSNETSNINNGYNHSENTLNSFNNNYLEECYDNYNSEINQNNINNNMNITRINKKLVKNKNFHKINYIKKPKKTIEKNITINNNNKENLYLDINNTYSNNDLENKKNFFKIKGNSNVNIKLPNKNRDNADNTHFYKINNSKKYFVNHNHNNKPKNQKQKKPKEIMNMNKIELNEPYDGQFVGNLTTLDNYAYNYYYRNDNF